ncbi:MAG: hypothetical protein ACI8ZF_000829 [Candidatus Midichloriaceae bacterium]|jgi:hypothetical protein
MYYFFYWFINIWYFRWDTILDGIQYKYFPVGKRFTIVATTFGIANSLAYTVSSFGLIPLTKYFGYNAILILLTPAVIGYCWAIFYFRKLEIKRGLYHNYPDEDFGDTGTYAKEQEYNYELGDEYEPFGTDCKYSQVLIQKIENLNHKGNNKVDINLVKKAIIFAKKWHGDQMRKTGEDPFYSHPLAVAGMIADYYFKTNIIVAAILHDVVEDTECSVETIKDAFNERISEMVDKLTSAPNSLKYGVSYI